MWKPTKVRTTILLLFTTTLLSRFCVGREFSLIESCSGIQTNSCVLSDIPTSYGNPFVIATNSMNIQLGELVLRNIILGRFPREILSNAPNLHTFIVDNCGVNRISSFDFEHASKLRTLILQRNRLSEISEKVFGAVPSLIELRLGQNHIHMVHRLAFSGLTELSHLDLQQNAIYTLPQDVFSPLVHLEYLDLGGNEITKIDASTFAANTRLNALLLNNNKFIVFEPNSLEHLPHLHLLDVSNGFVEELNTQSVDIIYAQNSSLKRCNIRGGVVKFYASNNELTELSIADKASVRELELHGNLLDSLNDFVEMVNLQHLDLSKNHISSLANARSPLYLSLPNLNYLNLAFNKLRNLTMESFLLMPKLTYLDLAFNHFASLDTGVFEPVRRLEKLFLDGNELHSFDYRKFYREHPFLRELGSGANSWNPHDKQEMIGFFELHSVKLVDHYSLNYQKMISTSSNPDTLQQHLKSSTTHLEHIQAPQCASSRGDIIPVMTLVLVFIIFVLQIVRMSREQNCISLFWRRKTSRLGQQWQTEPLDESVSEV